jgi:hypothetical protein
MTLTPVPVRLDHEDTIAADSTLIIHRPRRRRWWPAAVVAVMVAVLLGVGLAQVRSPALAFDGVPTLWRTMPGDDTSLRSAVNTFGTEVTVGFEQRGTFTAELALVNHGRYPVRVTGFPQRGAYTYGLESVEVAADKDGARHAFEPFTLRRGATRWLVLHFRFADCALDHSSAPPTARTSFPVSYRVFRLHQRQNVPFNRFAFSVPSGRCDRPVM